MIKSYKQWQIYCDVSITGQTCFESSGTSELCDPAESFEEAKRNAEAIVSNCGWVSVGRKHGCALCITEHGMDAVRADLKRKRGAQGGTR